MHAHKHTRARADTHTRTRAHTHTWAWPHQERFTENLPKIRGKKSPAMADAQPGDGRCLTRSCFLAVLLVKVTDLADEVTGDAPACFAWLEDTNRFVRARACVCKCNSKRVFFACARVCGRVPIKGQAE
jgi:hypothetical protein